MDEHALRAYLLDTRNRVSPATAAEETDDSPGVYAIFVKDGNCLHPPFREYLASLGHFCIYIGKTSHGEPSLRRRLVEQDLNGSKGASSFFRSLGVVRGYKPPPGSLIGKSNQNNFQFSPCDKQRIVEWVKENLMVAWQKFDARTANKLEVPLIHSIRPLLNLQNNPYRLSELKTLRAEAREIARKR